MGHYTFTILHGLEVQTGKKHSVAHAALIWSSHLNKHSHASSPLLLLGSSLKRATCLAALIGTMLEPPQLCRLEQAQACTPIFGPVVILQADGFSCSIRIDTGTNR